MTSFQTDKYFQIVIFSLIAIRKIMAVINTIQSEMKGENTIINLLKINFGNSFVNQENVT